MCQGPEKAHFVVIQLCFMAAAGQIPQPPPPPLCHEEEQTFCSGPQLLIPMGSDKPVTAVISLQMPSARCHDFPIPRRLLHHFHAAVPAAAPAPWASPQEILGGFLTKTPFGSSLCKPRVSKSSGTAFWGPSSPQSASEHPKHGWSPAWLPVAPWQDKDGKRI